MSAKNAILKKTRKIVRKSKIQMVNGMAKELLGLPLKDRVRLAIRIVFKGKL